MSHRAKLCCPNLDDREIDLKFQKQVYLAGLLACIVMFVGRFAFADLDPMSPMYELQRSEPKVDLSARPLAGKVMRYGYHTFWEVNKDRGVQGAPAAMVHDLFFYENGDCEWFSIDIFAGEHERQRCGTVKVAENMYQISWLEPESEQVVTMTINLNSWTINSSFHFNEGKGLALWQGNIISFGDIPDPPMTVPEQ
jgi:hypothetical protein